MTKVSTIMTLGLVTAAISGLPHHQSTRTEGIDVSKRNESAAVTVALAHIEAWSHHDWEAARRSLAPDVHVTVTTTQPIMAATDVVGVDKYMEGLEKFAGGVEVGSARVIASVGDEHNALVMVTVKGAFGPGGAKVALPAARLYLVDDNRRIKSEQVIFYAASR